MSAVAVLLVAVGCADIVRRLTARTWAAALTVSPHGIGPWARDIVLDFGP